LLTHEEHEIVPAVVQLPHGLLPATATRLFPLTINANAMDGIFDVSSLSQTGQTADESLSEMDRSSSKFWLHLSQ